MADRLVVFEKQNVYRIGWYLQEEQDMGATLGEEDKREFSKDEWDYKLAIETIEALPDVEKDKDGYFWESRKEAQEVLKQIKTAIKSYQSGVKMPDWAKKALAAGWKPPKGWKP